ncbi:MAG TPA: hypothetical protein DIC34_16350, partial [Treponema sp.]|nr:hypothetical protein [Treponema sp.]
MADDIEAAGLRHFGHGLPIRPRDGRRIAVVAFISSRFPFFPGTVDREGLASVFREKVVHRTYRIIQAEGIEAAVGGPAASPDIVDLQAEEHIEPAAPAFA